MANSRTSLSDTGPDDPSQYIEVNPRVQSSQQTEFGSVMVRFYWNLIAETVTSSYQIRNINSSQIKRTLQLNPVDAKTLHSFYGQLGYYFSQNNIFDGTDYSNLEENLNREVNRSLLSVRTSISDTLGSGTATIVLENFQKQWIFQDKGNFTFRDLVGQAIFLKGLYVVIDAKGRFNNDNYYRIFQGSVKGVSEIDNPLERKITLNCRDLTKLLGFSRINVSPAIFNTDISVLQGTVPVTASQFQNHQTSIQVAEIAIPLVNNAKWKEASDKFSLSAFKETWHRPDSLPVDEHASEIQQVDVVTNNYRKITHVGNATYKLPKQLPGIAENYALIWGDKTVDTNSGTFSTTTPNPIYATSFNSFQLFTNELKTRLDLIQELALLTFFVSYIDSSGNIHFHPPRFDYTVGVSSGSALDQNPIYPLNYPDGTLESPWIYTLLPGESISESYSSDEEMVCTNVKVVGESDFGITNLIQSQTDPTYKRANVVWWDGMKRYGFREHIFRTAAFQDETTIKTVGLSVFMRKYLEVEQMSASMPMRPEMDVDRPFYIQERGWVYHIRSISHSYSAGTDEGPGEYSTSVDCYAGRPISQATLIPSNIFKLLDFDQVSKAFRDHGFNLDVNIFTPEA
jgi:hypothetical protein